MAFVVLFYGCKQNHSQDKEPYIVDNLTKVDLKLDIDSMTNSNSSIEVYFDLEGESIYVPESAEQYGQADMLMALYLKKKLNIPDGQDLPILNSPPPPPPMKATYKLRTQQDDVSGKFKVILSQTQKVTKSYQVIGRDSITFQAYPVLIKNMTDSLLTLDCEGRRLFMVQQAKDEQGLWREVEYWRDDNENPYCSMGDNSIQMVPNSGVMSKTPAFKGDFNTEIRIKLFSEGKLADSQPVNKGNYLGR